MALFFPTEHRSCRLNRVKFEGSCSANDAHDSWRLGFTCARGLSKYYVHTAHTNAKQRYALCYINRRRRRQSYQQNGQTDSKGTKCRHIHFVLYKHHQKTNTRTLIAITHKTINVIQSAHILVIRTFPSSIPIQHGCDELK